MYATFLIWGDGRHLRLPSLLRARNNLDFTTRNNAGTFLTHLGGPRRNHKHPAEQGRLVESTANRHEFIHQQAFPPARAHM